MSDQCCPYMLLQVKGSISFLKIKRAVENGISACFRGLSIYNWWTCFVESFSFRIPIIFLSLKFGIRSMRQMCTCVYSFFSSQKFSRPFVTLLFMWVLWLKKVLRITSKILRYPLFGCIFLSKRSEESGCENDAVYKSCNLKRSKDLISHLPANERSLLSVKDVGRFIKRYLF